VQFEYRDQKGPPIRQLYVDPDALSEHAARGRWRCEVLFRSQRGPYLARLVRSNHP
jgi:hypothetical protein